MQLPRALLERQRRAPEQPEGKLNGRANADGEGHSAHPDRAAEGRASAECSELERGTDESDAKRCPPRADDHQRVARP
jgi:hypothetical protein